MPEVAVGFIVSPMMVGDNIKAERERRGWSQSELARKARISQPVIAELESGAQKTTKKLPAIAAAFGLSPADLDPAYATGHYRPPPEFFGDVDLPVFSAVEGGPGEMVVSTDPIDHVLRPWFLRNVKDGYAVVVTGESMVPVYEPGDLVIVNPRLPVIKGKNAIFVADEEVGGFTATVKRLEKTTAMDWHVRQWNPPEGAGHELTLSKKRWPKALRIVGRYEGG